MAEPTIFVATPLHDGKVSHVYLSGALELTARMPGRTRFDVKIGSFLPRNRDILTSRFLESGCSHMMCVDSDIGWRAEHVATLLAEDRWFISGCYAKKDSSREIPARLTGRVDRGLHEADYVPGGFLLLSRACVAAMRAHYADLDYTTNQGHKTCALWAPLYTPGQSYDGEDVAFCRRWRAMGGEIWLHPGVSLQHIGDHSYTPDVPGAPIAEAPARTQNGASHAVAPMAALAD